MAAKSFSALGISLQCQDCRVSDYDTLRSAKHHLPGPTMKETQKIIETLKRCLHARGLSYRDLAVALSLSESSVKRLFSRRTFTLDRLERVCAVLGMSVAELARLSDGGAQATSQPASLSLEQERTLARKPPLLACFYLLLNGHSREEVARRLDLAPRAMRTLMAELAAVDLLVSGPDGEPRPRAALPVAWRPDGPVRRLYERQVREEFLRSDFVERQAALTFHSAELSAASVRVLLRKMERLALDFADLAALDRLTPARDRSSVAMLLACRPWVFSMFSAYRAQR
jgi:transcriptional regulator with XRE-family HTH domain